jgi:hypothetical protein
MEYLIYAAVAVAILYVASRLTLGRFFPPDT